jgi:hypothetical protein
MDNKQDTPEKKKINWLNMFLLAGVPIISLLIVSFFKSCSK